MKRAWESRWAARAFEVASRSPLIDAHTKRIDRLARLSPGDLAQWREERWQRWRRHVRRSIPYYKGSSFSGTELGTWPLLPKAKVRRNTADLRNPLIPARALSTGGTGGQPLLVHISNSSYFTEWGYIAYAWRSGGISLTDPKVTFRGGSLGRGYSDGPVVYQPTYNQVLVSPFHLKEDTYRQLLDKLRDLRVKAIWGYPSAISMFAQWVRRNGPFDQLSSISTVLLGSEPAFDWQIELFESVFDARVVRWYGMTEKSVFAVECGYREGYHVIPSYGATEVVDGRIVGTGYTNRAMPLVRYDTEDMATWDSTECRCGLPFPRLKSIATKRDQTFLFGFGDEPISTVALNFHDPIFSSFSNFQFRQTEAGRITLLLVPAVDDDGLRTKAREARDAIQRRVGDNCAIELEVVSRNQLLSERGKLLVIDQRYQPVEHRAD